MISGDTIAALSSASGPAADDRPRQRPPRPRPGLPTLPRFGPSPPPRLGRAAPPALRRPGRAGLALLLRRAAQLHRRGSGRVSPPRQPHRSPACCWKNCNACGCRPAEAGEFTARAYFHGRMDLTGAEGVAATISAANEGELRAARQLLGGELARRLRPAMDLVAQTLALLEVGHRFRGRRSHLPAGRRTPTPRHRGRGDAGPDRGRQRPLRAAGPRADGGSRRPAQRRQEHAAQRPGRPRSARWCPPSPARRATPSRPRCRWSGDCCAWWTWRGLRRWRAKRWTRREQWSRTCQGGSSVRCVAARNE